MSRKLYIAGGSSDRFLIQSFIDRLGERWTITFDWTRWRGWFEVTDALAREGARLDLEAVRAADVIWVALPDSKSEGAHAELGAALALRKDLIVSGDITALGRVFPRLATTHFRTHGEAFTHLWGLRAPRA